MSLVEGTLKSWQCALGCAGWGIKMREAMRRVTERGSTQEGDAGGVFRGILVGS